MAYLAQQEEQNKQGQPGQVPEVKTNENVVGGQAGAIGGNGGSGGQAPAAGQPSKSGSFTNLQKYVGANAGNDGAMGQAIQNNTDQKIGGQNQQADGFKNNATSAIDAGTTKTDTALLTQLQNDPTKVDKNTFTTNYNATYQGPSAVEAVDGFNDVNKGYGDLVNTGKQLGEFDGRQTILNNTYGQGQKYTQGEQRLDSFILGAGEQGKQALNNINTNINNANTGWNNTLSTIGQGIQSGIDTTKAAQDATRTTFDGAVKNNEANFAALQNQANSMTIQNNNQVSQLQSALTYAVPGSASYNQAISQIGLTPEQATQLKLQGVNLASLVKSNAPVSLGDLANKTNVNNYTALLNLIGAKPEKFNFATSNADKSAFSVDQAAIDKGVQDYLTAEALKQREAEAALAIANMNAARGGTEGDNAGSAAMVKNAPGLQNLTPEQVAVAQAMAQK